MTNQLTYTDIDTNTVATPPSPASSISTCDIRRSGLRSGGGRRRSIALTGLGLVAVASIGAAAVAAVSREAAGPATPQASASAIIQAEIDAALAEHAAAPVRPPAYLIVQNEIDAALARSAGDQVDGRSASAIIQAE
ncbi:MAG: hypothetical protein KDB16_19825, partial [Acidimicrobiales bacterium]|nr:hypothetical protein [Acidimicrobiales bacterium]